MQYLYAGLTINILMPVVKIIPFSLHQISNVQIEIGSNLTTIYLSKVNIIETPTPIQDIVVKIQLLNLGRLVPDELTIHT